MKQLRVVVWFVLLTALVLPLIVLPISSANAQSENRIFVNVDFLNLRTGPDAKYQVLGVLNGGEDYAVIAKSPDGTWFKVTGTPFGDGWVRGRFTIFRGDINSVPVDSGPYGALEPFVFLVFINVPAFERPGGEPIGTVTGGQTQYQVVGRSYDGLWVQVRAPIGDVWLTTSSGAFRGSWFDVPITYGLPEPVTFGPTVNTIFVNVEFLNLRTGPDAKYAILGILRGGQQYTVAGISPDRIWFYIVGTPFGDGWVRGGFTIFRGDINEVPVIEPPYGQLLPSTFVVAVYIPVFDAPRGRELQFLLPPGEYAVTGRNFAGGWIRLDTPQFGEVWTQFSRGFFRGVYFNVPIIDERVITITSAENAINSSSTTQNPPITGFD